MPGSKRRGLSVLDVVWCPNPMRPAGDRDIRRLVLTGTDTVDSIVRRLALQPAMTQATLNGLELPRKRWKKKRVKSGDVLELCQVARGVETATMTAKLVMQANMAWQTAATLAAVLSFVANAAIAFTLSTLAGSLMRRDGANSSDRESREGPTAYSVEGGSNDIRLYEPLPLVLGEHRIYPDYASRPFAEFVLDPSMAMDVINDSPQFETLEHPNFDFEGLPPEVIAPWELIETITGWGSPYDVYGDEAQRTYTSSSQGTVTQPHTFIVMRTELADYVTTYEDYQQWRVQVYPPAQPITASWHPLGTPLPVIVRYGYEVIYKTERLCSIFSAGFGDLTLTAPRIGANSLDSYNQVELHHSYVPSGQGDRTRLQGYTSVSWPGDDYPDNVQSLEGGALEQGPNVINDGWIERQSSRAGRYVQIDLAGRLVYQDGGSFVNLSCSFDAQYWADDAAAWADFSFSPITLTNGSTTIVRETFSEMLAQPASKFRVRRSTPNYSDASAVAEFECPRIKVFRESSALYPAQRRLGLLIKATGQLSGAVDRFSVLAQAKHWIWTPTTPWDGTYPGGPGWSWGHTVNPAWLFLYYSRGGFLNSTASPAHLGQAGWLDEPAMGNGARLFGAGLENARIDYASIVAWGQFCDAHNLMCRMVVHDDRPAGDVLDDIAAAGRASKTWATGKLGVWWEAAGQPEVATIGMSHIIAGTFKVSYLTEASVDEYELMYTRSDDDYEPGTVSAIVPGVELPVNRKTEQAVYSMPETQAQRLVNLIAASDAYHIRTIQFETNAMGGAIRRGDIVRLAHDLTRWAFSGRLVKLLGDGEKIVQIELSSTVEHTGASEHLYVQIQPPGGAPFVLVCIPPQERTHLLQVIGVLGGLPVSVPWELRDAPGWLDTTVQNGASDYPNTIPEDWIYIAGPTETPGKRCRIVGMEPASNRRYRLTLRDEYEAYYPLEWGGLDNAPVPASGERRVARAFNPVATPAAEGGWLLEWELDAAHGADVFVSVNGGAQQQVPVRGHVTVAGREILLPGYPSGTQLYLEIHPVAAGTLVAVEGCELSLTT